MEKIIHLLPLTHTWKLRSTTAKGCLHGSVPSLCLKGGELGRERQDQLQQEAVSVREEVIGIRDERTRQSTSPWKGAGAEAERERLMQPRAAAWNWHLLHWVALHGVEEYKAVASWSPEAKSRIGLGHAGLFTEPDTWGSLQLPCCWFSACLPSAHNIPYAP